MENNPKLTACQQELLDDLKEFKEKREEEFKKMMAKYPKLLTPLTIEGHKVAFVIDASQFRKI